MTPRTFHTGPPAFTSLMPAMPAPEPVSPALARAVSEYCGFPVEVQSLGAAGPTPEGRYLLHRRDDGTPLFLKIFDARIVALQQHSNRVATYLAGHGVPVVLSLPGEPRPFAAGYYGELFPYLDTRFSNGSEAELAELGRILAAVHRALKTYQAAEITSAAAEMHQRLMRAAGEIRAGWVPHADAAAELCAAADGYAAGPLSIHDAAQMIHGDCNYTNVLVERSTGRLTLIDFEESRAGWLHPAFDVAKAIERFVMVATTGDAAKRAAALLGGYRDHGGRLPACDLRRVLVESNDRALMIMADKTREGLALPAAEWHKFISLKALAERHAPLLDRLSDGIARQGPNA